MPGGPEGAGAEAAGAQRCRHGAHDGTVCGYDGRFAGGIALIPEFWARLAVLCTVPGLPAANGHGSCARLLSEMNECGCSPSEGYRFLSSGAKATGSSYHLSHKRHFCCVPDTVGDPVSVFV